MAMVEGRALHDTTDRVSIVSKITAGLESSTHDRLDLSEL